MLSGRRLKLREGLGCSCRMGGGHDRVRTQNGNVDRRPKDYHRTASVRWRAPAGDSACPHKQARRPVCGLHRLLKLQDAATRECDAIAKKTTNRWSQDVKTVSTFPPEGLFAQDAQTIARVMASKKVSPKGIGSGIRMVQFLINRAGRNLPPERRKELEKAKQILQTRARQRAKMNRRHKSPPQ